jgi:hypothetical protein
MSLFNRLYHAFGPPPNFERLASLESNLQRCERPLANIFQLLGRNFSLREALAVELLVETRDVLPLRDWLDQKECDENVQRSPHGNPREEKPAPA